MTVNPQNGFWFVLWLKILHCSILDPKITFTEQESMVGALTENILGGMTPLLTPYDLKRLESYASNLVDYHLVRHEHSFLN